MQEEEPKEPEGTGDGPLILVVGILGLFMQALGPVAWVWGNQALKRARPAQAGLIQAGRLLGMIDTAILVLVVVAGIAYSIFLLHLTRMIGDMASAPTPPSASTPAHKLPTRPHKPILNAAGDNSQD